MGCELSRLQTIIPFRFVSDFLFPVSKPEIWSLDEVNREPWTRQGGVLEGWLRQVIQD